MRKVNLLLCLGFFSLTLVWGCAKKEGGIVAKVGDREITVEELENEFQRQSRLIIQGRSKAISMSCYQDFSLQFSLEE